MPKKPKTCHWCGQPAHVKVKKADLTVNACEPCARRWTSPSYSRELGRRLFSGEPQGWSRGKRL